MKGNFYFNIQNGSYQINSKILNGSSRDDLYLYDTPNVTCILNGDIYAFDGGYLDKENFVKKLLTSVKEKSVSDFLSNVDGYYSLIIYFKNDGSSFLISDRLGLKPLFYAKCNDKVVACSDSLFDLVNIHTELDWSINFSAVKFFVETNSFLNDDTYFINCKRLMPSTFLISNTHANLIETTYWTWNKISESSISFDDAVVRLHSLFEKSVSKRLVNRNSISLTLSGGLDSRALLGACISLGVRNIKAFTFGDSNSPDVLIAKQCCEVSNIEHEIVPLDLNNWMSNRYDCVLKAGGMANYMHMHIAPAVDAISNYSPNVLNGYVGDLVAGGGYIQVDSRGNYLPVSLAAKLKYGSSNLNILAYKNDFFDENNSDSFFLYQRGVRFTSVGSDIVNTEIVNLKPFVDNELLEFLYSLPSSYRYEGRLYHSMLRKYYPDLFEEIPWQARGLCVKYSGPYKHNYYDYFLFSVKHHLKNSFLFPLAKVTYDLVNFKRNSVKKTFVKYNDWIHHADFLKVVNTINDKDSFSRYILGHEKVESIISNAYQAEGSVDPLGALVSLEIFFENLNLTKSSL